MSVILDIFVVGVFVFSVVIGWKRGFVKTLLKFAGSLISMVVAVAFASPVASCLNDWFIADWLSSAAEGALTEQLAQMGSDFEALFEKMPEGFRTLLDRFGVGQGEMEQQYTQLAGAQKTDGLIAEELADYMTAGAAKAVSYVLAFLLLYIVSYILVKVLIKLVDPIFKLPLLHTANALLGAVLGALIAVVFLWVTGLLIENVVPYLVGEDSVFMNNFSGDNTLLYRFFANINPLGSLL